MFLLFQNIKENFFVVMRHSALGKQVGGRADV
jgi:hypothetical protein